MSSDTIFQLLHELLKNSKRSDRDLAKSLGVSQPTLTRMRKRLEKEEYILEYTVIPNLAKLGFEIITFSLLNIDRYDPKSGELDYALGEGAHKWVADNTQIIFAAGGEGLEGRNCMMISVHKDFTAFSNFISDFRQMGSARIKHMDSFLVSLKGKIPKPFSFRALEIIS